MAASKNTPSIVLIGDSILDNFQYLNEPRDLSDELKALGFNVHNYAVDGTKVSNVIDGVMPDDVCQVTRSYPYEVDADGKMRPLTLLSKLANVNKSFPTVYNTMFSRNDNGSSDNMVVLSVGGNNIKDKLSRIVFGPETFMNSVLSKEFVADYERVINATRSSCPKLVLISIYLPYLGKGSSYAKYSKLSKPITDLWHDFLFSIAKKHNIPVLDLNRTFDVNNRDHYGSIETHPSNISSKCMAECLAHIHKDYCGYKVYFAPNCDAKRIQTD